MTRCVYIWLDNNDKKEKLIHFLKNNNRYMTKIEPLFEKILYIEEEYTKFEQLVDYKHIYNIFSNEIKTDMSIVLINKNIFKDIDLFIKEFLENTYCNVYDASSLVYYCFVTDEHDEIIEQFYTYFSKLDDEILKTIYFFLDNNLNALKTARDLFVHRNTLSYRLNKFHYLTGVDIRTTQSASLIHSYRIRHHYRFIR